MRRHATGNAWKGTEGGLHRDRRFDCIRGVAIVVGRVRCIMLQQGNDDSLQRLRCRIDVLHELVQIQVGET